MEFKIEKGIKVSFSGSLSRYPFDKMKKGDSFFVPKTGGRTVKADQCKVGNASKYYILRNNLDWKFTTRTESGGVRIWRIK